MNGNVFLQIFLFVDVFFGGVLAAIALRHARAHFNPVKHDAQSSTPKLPVLEDLPASVKENLIKSSQEKYETILNQAALSLDHNLQSTAEQIDNLIKKLATEIISSELERYRADLGKLHFQAEKDLGTVKTNMDGYQEQIKVQIAQELEAEKQRLVKQIDTKLADAVGSFLVDALQHNVDLGSQGPYLISLLEEHKADFIKEVGDESKPA
jgi:hypothetical protein